MGTKWDKATKEHVIIIKGVEIVRLSDKDFIGRSKSEKETKAVDKLDKEATKLGLGAWIHLETEVPLQYQTWVGDPPHANWWLS